MDESEKKEAPEPENTSSGAKPLPEEGGMEMAVEETRRTAERLVRRAIEAQYMELMAALEEWMRR